jgi:hypothetical protein
MNGLKVIEGIPDPTIGNVKMGKEDPPLVVVI